ncbi:AI-2E family transporter, partial [Streptococcus uberis]|nr:AI-2E family transporter [Streptococcus uberis]MCK1226568.1 AI-2E family transporter [Streptococcus uberis]
LRGVVGMIIAVPLAATCYQMIRDNIEKKQAIQKKQIS